VGRHYAPGELYLIVCALDVVTMLCLWLHVYYFQAGVSLGLAGIIGDQFALTFGSNFRSTMVGVILVNQIIGPIGAKYLIKYCHEDGQGSTDFNYEYITLRKFDLLYVCCCSRFGLP
jgi:hypothetical protein